MDMQHERSAVGQCHWTKFNVTDSAFCTKSNVHTHYTRCSHILVSIFPSIPSRKEHLMWRSRPSICPSVCLWLSSSDWITFSVFNKFCIWAIYEMFSSKRGFRGNNICSSLSSFKRNECILPAHFVLLARLGEIWYGKYTNTVIWHLWFS